MFLCPKCLQDARGSYFWSNASFAFCSKNQNKKQSVKLFEQRGNISVAVIIQQIALYNIFDTLHCFMYHAFYQIHQRNFPVTISDSRR